MNNKNPIKIFYRLFFVAAIFFSVFVLSQLGDNFVAVGIAGVVLLIAGYLYFAQNEKEKQEEREHERMELDRKLDELLNAQRAIYTITKRGNIKIEKELAATHEDVQAGLERVLSENQKLAQIQVNALKTVAKYNRENTRQLILNINKNADRFSAKLQNGAVGLQQDIGEVPEETQEAEALYQGMSMNGTDTFGEDADVLWTGSEPEQSVEADLEFEPTAEPESSTEASSELEPTAEPETSGEPAEKELPPTPPPMPIIDDPNKKLSPDEIAALFASAGGGAGAETVSEPEVAAGSEPITEPSPEPASELTTEPVSVPEPFTNQTPEPILDSISIEIPEPDQIIIPEPEPTQTPTSVPNLDDPNKKLSPDDIEALIASLTPQE